MLLLNYDFYDIYYVLTMLRTYPKIPYNCEVIKTIFDTLTTPQVDNTIEDNIIRKRLRAIKDIETDILVALNLYLEIDRDFLFLYLW